jgi:GNAT superfamily N-acetyltransferase
MRYLSEDEIYNEHGPPLTQSLNEIKQEFSQQVFLKGYIKKNETKKREKKGDRSYKIENIVGSVRGYLEKGTAYIGRLIVKPEYQNKGIRTRVMQAIEQYFKFASCHELFITGHKSSRNLYLYQKLGYHEFKRISRLLAYIF